MDRLSLGALLVAVSLVGCGSSEPSAMPSAGEGQAIQDSKAAWDDQKLEAFKASHAEEGRLTPGQKAAAGQSSTNQASK